MIIINSKQNNMTENNNYEEYSDTYIEKYLYNKKREFFDIWNEYASEWLDNFSECSNREEFFNMF